MFEMYQLIFDWPLVVAGEITSERCKAEVGRLLVESRADIHVDPLLFQACSLDIKHYCFAVPAGEGRRE